MKKIDKLIKDLAVIPNPSGEEEKMISFLLKNMADDCNVEVDEFMNIFVTKGDAETYPTVLAHMDGVNRWKEIELYSAREKKTGNTLLFGRSKSGKKLGINWDDKAGIWIALKLLETLPAAKAAFFVEEEVGCIGSNSCDLKFFEDSAFIIQADRRGSSDIIYTAGAVETMVSDQFEIAAADTLIKYGFSEDIGSFTDASTLCERGVGISCMYFSCGYYNAHTAKEYLVYEELIKSFDFAKELIENLMRKLREGRETKYKHEAKVATYTDLWSKEYANSYGVDYLPETYVNIKDESENRYERISIYLCRECGWELLSKQYTYECENCGSVYLKNQ